METILTSSQDFIDHITHEFSNSFDLHFEVLIDEHLTLVYLDSLVDKAEIERHFLKPLRRLPLDENIERRTHTLRWDRILPLLAAKDRVERTSSNDVIQDILAGKTVAHLSGDPAVYSFNTRKIVKRQLTEPVIERTVRGPQVSFMEAIADNVALIRQGIKNPDLVLEKQTLGVRTQTDIMIGYLNNLVNNEALTEVHRRIRSFEIDGVIDSGYLEQLISDNPWSLFPLTQSTERPDKMIAAILEGRVAILVDGSPQAILIPVTINELYQSPDDYYFGFWYGSFLRFFRILGNNIAVALPGLYLALVGVNPELLPIKFALNISGSRMGVAVPLIIELLGMEVIVEVFREASLRLPIPISQTLGITAGIVLGTAVIAAGLVSNATLVIVILTAIASYSGPNYSIGITWRILKYVLIFAAAFTGLFGYTIVGIMILTNAVTQNSFGVPYLAPWSPVSFRGLIDTVMRRPIWLPRRLNPYHPDDRNRFSWKKKEPKN